MKYRFAIISNSDQTNWIKQIAENYNIN